MNQCTFCGREDDRRLGCSLCKETPYCSKACLKEDWKNHVTQCIGLNRNTGEDTDLNLTLAEMNYVEPTMPQDESGGQEQVGTNPLASAAALEEFSQVLNPSLPPVHQPPPVRVSTGPPTDLIETCPTTPAATKSREQLNLQSFNKAGYSEAFGSQPETRTRKKGLHTLQSDHIEWVEKLHDQIEHFMSYGPVLPHEGADFRKKISRLKEDLSYLICV